MPWGAKAHLDMVWCDTLLIVQQNAVVFIAEHSSKPQLALSTFNLAHFTDVAAAGVANSLARLSDDALALRCLRQVAAT